MATRRPNVPRVSPAARAPEATEDADVIRANFGAGARGAAVKATGGPDGSGPPAGTNPGTRGTGATVQGASRKQDASAAPAAPPEDLDPVPAKAFSGRMLALAVVVTAITVMLAPTVKIYIDKRAEISALEADIASRQADQAELNQEIARWQDPNYVKQQARDRINMVMPGETSYWVFGSDAAAETQLEAPPGAGTESAVDVPWVDALWESVRRSGTD